MSYHRNIQNACLVHQGQFVRFNTSATTTGYHTSASDPQNTLHSPKYSIPINFSGQARQLEAIITYNFLEAIGKLQGQKLPHWSHNTATLMYTGVQIDHTRLTFSSPSKYSHWTNNIENPLPTEVMIGPFKLIVLFFLDQAKKFPPSGKFDWVG